MYYLLLTRTSTKSKNITKLILFNFDLLDQVSYTADRAYSLLQYHQYQYQYLLFQFRLKKHSEEGNL